VAGIFNQVGEASTEFDPDGDWDFTIDILTDNFETWAGTNPVDNIPNI
jgi:hypothetical protein